MASITIKINCPEVPAAAAGLEVSCSGQEVSGSGEDGACAVCTQTNYETLPTGERRKKSEEHKICCEWFVAKEE